MVAGRRVSNERDHGGRVDNQRRRHERQTERDVNALQNALFSRPYRYTDTKKHSEAVHDGYNDDKYIS